MRPVLGVLGIVACAAMLGACGLVSGLSSFSSEPCTDGCDASPGPAEGGKPGNGDATVDTGTTGEPDSTGPGSEASDDEAGEAGEDASEDAPMEAGCSAGLISCSGACVDPSMISNCGACGVVCDGDAALCASMDAGFACASSCPASTTMCGSSCVDTTSNVTNCKTCGNVCATVPHGSATCVTSACGLACDTSYTLCAGACVDFTTDANNCGGCGSAHACSDGATCTGGVCQAPPADAGPDTGAGGADATAPKDAATDTGSGGGQEAGTDGGSSPHDAGVEAGVEAGLDAGGDGSIPCPTGGCPSSTATGFACAVGGCNASGGACTAASQGCYCTADSQCLSQKCVKVTGNNDSSCTTCTGSGAHDGFACEIASPGIPPVTTAGYMCPAGSGYGATTLACNAAHTGCYCTNDNQCPSGKCVQNAANNNNCSGLGPCTGTGTPDYRGCQAPAAYQSSCNGIGYCGGGTCSIGTCSVIDLTCLSKGVCLCTNDNQCDSGKCVISTGSTNNSSACGSSCTGSGTADANSCQVAGAIACTGSSSYACTTTLSPTPVPNAGNTQCLCVADGDCPSGQCVNANSQCTGTCSGTGTADNQDCKVISSAATAWSCSSGNCKTVSSSSGKCTAAGTPCWCTADTQCPGGDQCSSWAGCSGSCTGTGTGNAFNCVP